jgi:hypothetical protein
MFAGPRPDIAAYVLHGVERAAADEDGESAEQRLLLRREQVVAPGDSGAERLLTERQIARAAAQELEG